MYKNLKNYEKGISFLFCEDRIEKLYQESF